jgi:hypothetical protein
MGSELKFRIAVVVFGMLPVALLAFILSGRELAFIYVAQQAAQTPKVPAHPLRPLRALPLPPAHSGVLHASRRALACAGRLSER